MKTKVKARKKRISKCNAGPRARTAGAARGRQARGSRETLRVLPAGPVAAFGMGELLIRAWAARQYAA